MIPTLGAVALSIFVFSAIAWAEQNPILRWTLAHVRGEFQYKNFAHFKDTENDQRTVRQEGVLKLEIDQSFQERWRLFLVPRWRADTANYTAEPFQNFRDTFLHDSYFYIQEGYLKYSGGDFDLAVGKQIYAWGTADGFNPTDNLNPYNYLDVPQREKMGIFSFSASYYPPDASVDFVVIPLFTPSRLPLLSSRWAAEDTGAIIERRELPGKRMDKIQIALRAKKTISGWDVSLSYFDGYDTLPVLRQTGVITFRPQFSRMHVIGTDFTTTSGKLEYHGEFAWRIYDGGQATDILPFVLGGNYTWDEDQVSWLGLEQLIFTLEYVGEFHLQDRDDPPYQESAIFTRPFQISILSRFTLKFDDDNELRISGSANFHGHNNSYLQPKFMHKFSPSLKFEGGWEIFWGPANSFWGKWKRNDRTFAVLTYSF